MAAAVERTDELVREYLLFRGFTATLKQLDVEIKADKEKGFRVRAAEKDARRPELAGRHAGAGEGKEGMRSGGRLSAPDSGCPSPRGSSAAADTAVPGKAPGRSSAGGSQQRLDKETWPWVAWARPPRGFGFGGLLAPSSLGGILMAISWVGPTGLSRACDHPPPTLRPSCRAGEVGMKGPGRGSEAELNAPVLNIWASLYTSGIGQRQDWCPAPGHLGY